MRRADLSKKDALVETNNNESVSTSSNIVPMSISC